MYYVAYNSALSNALVGISYTPFADLPEGMFTEVLEGNIPDLSRHVWNGSALLFDTNSNSRYCTLVEFMRKFTQAERISIRQLEKEGDLIIIDAMSLMQGTEEGINLDDPDVLQTLQYLTYVKNVLVPTRIPEILS